MHEKLIYLTIFDHRSPPNKIILFRLLNYFKIVKRKGVKEN
jgi:hypothetical protein